MTTENKLAKDLYQHYRLLFNDLINIHAQARTKNILRRYPELEKAIWRAGVCLEAWHAIALKLAKQKYYQGE